MRHAQHGVPDAVRRAAAHQLVEQHDQRLAAFQREARLADEAAVQEFLEAFRSRQAIQDAALALRRQAGAGTRRLEAHLPPAALLGVGQVHVLRGQRAAIGLLQRGDQRAQFEILVREIRIGTAELRGQVRLVESVVRGREFGQARHGRPAQRVEVRLPRAHHPVGRDERLHRHLLAREPHDVGGQRPRRGRLPGHRREAFHDRAVRHVLRVGAVDGGGRAEGVEVVLPLPRHLRRIGQVLLVLVLHVRRVAAVEKGRALVALHAHGLFLRRVLQRFASTSSSRRERASSVRALPGEARLA